MAHEEALSAVNSMQRQLALLARSIVMALGDNKISGWESMQVGMNGMQTATAIMNMVMLTTPEVRQGMLYVLENGQWVLPEDMDMLRQQMRAEMTTADSQPMA